MADGKLSARDIIAHIFENPRTQAGGRFEGGRFTTRVYEDEPILMTGRAFAQGLPAVYQEVRSLARNPRAHGVSSSAWLFYEQGRLLADVEDDAPYSGTFVRYFPTYQDLNDRQLRGYITWRGAVRAGQTEEAPATFMFLYAYELLNGIGVAGPQEAFRTLREFWGRYRALEPTLDRYVRSWLVDLVVYHGLAGDLVAQDPDLNAEVRWDGYLRVVTDGSSVPHEAFDAWVGLSSYRFESSRLYKAQPQDAEAVTLAVLDRLKTYYAKHRKADLITSLFGTLAARPYQMFASAVVYHPESHPAAAYELDPLRTYTCSRGLWTRTSYDGSRDGRARLGAVLKAVDAAMRQRWGCSHPLKQPKVPKYLEQIIERAIDERLAWNATHTPRHIEIDRSKLGGIRSGAAQTCEALLVDEERCEEPPLLQPPAAGEQRVAGACVAALPLGEKPVAEGACLANAGSSRDAAGFLGEKPVAPPPSTAVPAPDAPGFSSAASLGLTAAERDLLVRLLEGEPLPPSLGGGQTVDLLVDAVNEKLFDLLGDTAVEFDGADPMLVDDYRDDVREALAL